MPVNHIQFSDITISAAYPVTATEAADISFKNIKILSPLPTLITLNNARNFTLDNIGYSDYTSTLVSAGGDKTSGISILNTHAENMPKPIVITDGADKNAVTIK